MHCPKCHFEQIEGGAECAKCGVIFAKWKPAGKPVEVFVPPAAASEPAVPEPTAFDVAKAWLFSVEPSVNPFYFAGRALVWLGLVVWGWKFLSRPMDAEFLAGSFLHNINLPFHEGGHVIFSLFGWRFLHVLGGSLGQILMPLICAGALLIQNRDAFGASVGLWWAAENFMDLAPYIGDARALDLPLLGGVTGKDVEDYHDWEYLLRHLGWLQYDQVLARASYNLGRALMIAALLWGAYVLMLQYRNLDRS